MIFKKFIILKKYILYSENIIFPLPYKMSFKDIFIKTSNIYCDVIHTVIVTNSCILLPLFLFLPSDFLKHPRQLRSYCIFLKVFYLIQNKLLKKMAYNKGAFKRPISKERF